ncbi:hypothetical protein [Endozoicomonas sp. 8E]|uniref:hypothetical protein n=1 Tax=Endozoicomonas sp. 8E TaxID=3035692 RepID=UPI0029392268|nr:hypothetical protein [Endozoicomonas sp. 8E]WOG30341.1 hypothetical protein P6910_12055 [Endozoicomonas sp. 8E]
MTLISSSSYGQLGFWKGYSISENLRDTYLRTLKIDKLNDDNTFSANTTISERDGSSLANFHAVGQVYFYETGYNISYVETFVSGILCDLSGCWKSPIGLFGDATISHEGVVIHGQWREVGLVGSVGAEFQLNLQPNISNIAQNQSLCGITHQCSFPEKNIYIKQTPNFYFNFTLAPQNFSLQASTNTSLTVVSFNESTYDVFLRFSH